MNKEIELFINHFVKEIEGNNAAIFVGAGFSIPAGYVNWKELVKPLADEIGLDVDKEHDLVRVAQYHFNENGSNRHRINQLIIEELSSNLVPTENHKILSRLQIGTFWTTNYDKLIEKSLESAGKIPDIKYTVPQLANTKPKRDAIVYKMHGDVDHSDQAVVTRDDYEKYERERGAFINALSGDLISKTFLFLGFSFTDPNLDYVLSRIRITFREHSRQHYCIFKKRTKEPGETEEDFRYEERKQELAIHDLKRFNIKTILVDGYEQITDILRCIENRYKRKTIFISGSAHEYVLWGQNATEDFLCKLSNALIDQNYKIVTGYGLGVGSAIVSGAIDGIYRAKKGFIEDSLIMRPFPLYIDEEKRREDVWKEYRFEMISRSGIAIFILGNKLQDGKVIYSQGVRREFEICNDLGVSVIPIGSSGYISKEIWDEVLSDFDKFYPNAKIELIEGFKALGENTNDPSTLISKILHFIHLITKD